MIFRPRIDAGELEEFSSRTHVAKSSNDATEDDFEKLEDGMKLMVGAPGYADHVLDIADAPRNTVAATDGLAEIRCASGARSSGDAGPGEVKVTLILGSALYEKLNKKCIALEKANKASERIADAALRVPVKSNRFAAGIESCSLLQEKAMTLEAQLVFLIKFKKTMDGEETTATFGEDYIARATLIINEMYEEAKVIKTLTAKPKKQED